jgi:hypothetical protein
MRHFFAHVAGAASRLIEALETFAAIPARFETARTHLALARLPGAVGGDAREHLQAAARAFRDLGAVSYERHTVDLARELGAEASLE